MDIRMVYKLTEEKFPVRFRILSLSLLVWDCQRLYDFFDMMKVYLNCI